MTSRKNYKSKVIVESSGEEEEEEEVHTIDSHIIEPTPKTTSASVTPSSDPSEPTTPTRAHTSSGESNINAATKKAPPVQSISSISSPPPAPITPSIPTPTPATTAKGPSASVEKVLEVVFAFDTTGSMEIYTAQLRYMLRFTCEQLAEVIPGIRIGLLAVSDYEADEGRYVVARKDLTTNISELVSWVACVSDTPGGRDYPEAYEFALSEARNFSWSPGRTVNKALVFIGDAVPHPPSFTTEHIYWRDQVRLLVMQGVKIYTVQVNQHAIAKDFFEEVAELSGGAYLTMADRGIMNDLFLAICYKAYDPQLLVEFKHEIIHQERFNDKLETMFAQLNSSISLANVGRRNTQPWYHTKYELADAIPSFCFDRMENKWILYEKAAPEEVTEAILKKRPRKEEKRQLKARLRAQKAKEKKAQKEKALRLREEKRALKEQAKQERMNLLAVLGRKRLPKRSAEDIAAYKEKRRIREAEGGPVKRRRTRKSKGDAEKQAITEGDKPKRKRGRPRKQAAADSQAKKDDVAKESESLKNTCEATVTAKREIGPSVMEEDESEEDESGSQESDQEHESATSDEEDSEDDGVEEYEEDSDFMSE